MKLALCIALSAAAPATAQTWYAGNLHAALGQATLDDSTPGELTVQNLGAAGADGVSIALGASHGVALGRRFEPIADALGTTYTTAFASGASPAGGHAWTRAGAGYGLDFDFTHLGATTFDLEVLSAGVSMQVFSALDSGDATLITAGPADVTVRVRSGEHSLRFATSVSVDVPGFGNASGDALVARPSSGGPNGGLITRADLTAAGIPQFTLRDEALVLWGAPHRALGEARFDMSGALAVQNIGSSGLDGVRVDLGDVTYATLELAPAEVLDGEWLRAAARANGAERGWAQLERNGGVLQLFSDFGATGATEVHVSVADYDVVFHGELLQTGGPLVTIAPGSSAQAPRVRGVWALPSGSSSVVFDFDSFVSITFPGGPTVEGPELHISAYLPTSQASAPFEVDVTARDKPSFRIERAYGFMAGFYLCWPAAQHSGGDFARLNAFTTLSSEVPLHLEVEAGPPGEFGYFLVSAGYTQPGLPISSGFLCLASPLARYVGAAGARFDSIGQFDASGRLINTAGTSNWSSGFDVPLELPLPIGGVFTSGSTFAFQAWFRDGTRSNFSTAVLVLF